MVAISFASAVSTQTANTTKKESPLFGVRTRRAIGERLQELKENIKARFIGERVFFLPFQWLNFKEEIFNRNNLGHKVDTMGFACFTKFETAGCVTCFGKTCYVPFCHLS